MILVTGATGLLGSHVLLELVNKGFSVKAAKRKSSKLDAVKKLFAFYHPQQAAQLWGMVSWVDMDALDYYSIVDALDNVEKVYHCAGMVSFDEADRQALLKHNVEGTANIVNACLEKGIQKIAFSSSIAALGHATDGLMIDEDTLWTSEKSGSAYSLSKFGAEREIWRGTEEGLNAVIVNPSVIIGPFDKDKSSGQLYKSIKKGLPFYTEGIGGFVDVRDVARVMTLLMESQIVNQRFLLNSENLPFKEMLNYIAIESGSKKPFLKTTAFMGALAWRSAWLASKLSGKKAAITKETIQSSMSRHSYSNEKIIKAIDYKFYSVHEAITNMCSFFEKEHLLNAAFD